MTCMTLIVLLLNMLLATTFVARGIKGHSPRPHEDIAVGSFVLAMDLVTAVTICLLP